MAIIILGEHHLLPLGWSSCYRDDTCWFLPKLPDLDLHKLAHVVGTQRVWGDVGGPELSNVRVDERNSILLSLDRNQPCCCYPSA